MPCEGAIHLRRAMVDDAEGIAAVHLRAWRRAHAGLVPDAYLDTVQQRQRVEFWREELKVEAPDREPWVALVGDRVIGFASAGLSRDDDADRETGEIYDVYVDPDCWGRGVGQNLLAHALKDLDEHGFSWASYWILAQNEAARGFAERHGWAEDGASRFQERGGTRVQEVRYSHQLR